MAVAVAISAAVAMVTVLVAAKVVVIAVVATLFAVRLRAAVVIHHHHMGRALGWVIDLGLLHHPATVVATPVVGGVAHAGTNHGTGGTANDGALAATDLLANDGPCCCTHASTQYRIVVASVGRCCQPGQRDSSH